MDLIGGIYTQEEIRWLESCTLCPRNCKANRFSSRPGFCKSDASFNISSISIHKGEEPVISGQKGICNIFFPHCNLQCIYCQNHEISINTSNKNSKSYVFGDLLEKICSVLDQTENIVGFVSPTHYIPQMLAIIRGIKSAGRNPVFVYNTNGYDSIETLKRLEGIIDVYLPDFKYLDKNLAKHYSGVEDYPEIASSAIQEMYRQKGATLILNEQGIAESGIIIRHLILPNALENSKRVLRFIAEEITPKLHISLMAQYFPIQAVNKHNNLNRTIYAEEYQQVIETYQESGLYRGWIQELESNRHFRPNFENDQAFEV